MTPLKPTSEMIAALAPVTRQATLSLQEQAAALVAGQEEFRKALAMGMSSMGKEISSLLSRVQPLILMMAEMQYLLDSDEYWLIRDDSPVLRISKMCVCGHLPANHLDISQTCFVPDCKCIQFTEDLLFEDHEYF